MQKMFERNELSREIPYDHNKLDSIKTCGSCYFWTGKCRKGEGKWNRIAWDMACGSFTPKRRVKNQ